MKTTLRAYEPSTDYLRIRDFLIDTFALYQGPFNWGIERWNFCRHFVIPLHSYYNRRDELPAWEKAIGVWESGQGEIVGVVHSENEEPGEVWIQIHPSYTSLYDEMVAYAEEHLADRAGNLGYVKLYVNERTELEGVARARGYRQLPRRMTRKEYIIGEVPAPQLPKGFVIKSVLEEDDVDKRRMAKAISFGAHYAPSDWGPASAYRQMQRAPDYRPDLDLFIVAPNGDYASFCTIWVDERNHYAVFEPVGTHAEYQRMGLGRALLAEGFKRMAQRGARRSFMDSSIEFYRKVGFQDTNYTYYAWIKYFAV